MITHQWCEYTKCKKTKQQFSCRITAKSSKVSTCIQETAHIQRRQHLQVKKDMRPPGFIIACPDSAITVHSDIRRSGKHQKTFFRVNAFKSFSCCPCHIVTKKIMHFVMTDLFAIDIVIKSFVIFRIIRNSEHLALHRPWMDLAFGILCKLSGKFFCLCKTFRRIKDRRLIHIIPETFYSLFDQKTIFVSEPFSGFRIQHIREMSISRPYSCNKITSVFSLAEIVVFDTFLVNLISRLNLDTGINDRDQANILVIHFLHEFRKIREILFTHCEIFECLHVINIHVNHVDWDMILPMSFCDSTEIFFRRIPPAALSETKSKLRWDIAASDYMTELFYDIICILTFKHINIQVSIFAGYPEGILSVISNIKGQFRWIVKKQSKCSLSTHNNKVVGSV